MDFKKLAEQYKSELFDNVLPFWLQHSQDRECGGYYTCLDRDGHVFDTDKFIWLQGREVWLFSMLYNKVEKRREWLDCAIRGGEFLKKYGHDGNYNWYFSLDRRGNPLVEPYNIFSYTFATMAFGQLSLATGNREYAEMFQDYTANKANQTAERRDAVQFVKQKLDSAQWFIDAIKQRNETLQRTMEAIIYLQRDFFLTGDEATLHPMILKDVAERAGYDISTISRVSNSKYVQTNFGIYPLKYFFSESMQTDTGEEISTREVKKIMKEHVDAEDKRKPLTDEELATILKEKGYVIARRTVAKYREQLGIPVARLRKEI